MLLPYAIVREEGCAMGHETGYQAISALVTTAMPMNE
jgi:hypothetical protein